MSRRIHRNHSPAFKANVALTAVKGDANVGGGHRLVQLARSRIPRRNHGHDHGGPLHKIPVIHRMSRPRFCSRHLVARIVA
jgi:hypothetical protein